MGEGNEVIEQINDAAERGDDIADTLLAISCAADRLLRAGITERALVILLADITPQSVTREAIKQVLRALPRISRFIETSGVDDETDPA